MTLNCYKSEFSRNFAWFRRFGRQLTAAKRMKIDPYCHRQNCSPCTITVLFRVYRLRWFWRMSTSRERDTGSAGTIKKFDPNTWRYPLEFGCFWLRTKCVNMSKTAGDTFQIYHYWLTESCIGGCAFEFRLTPRSMTWPCTTISSNFWRISRDFTDLGGNNCFNEWR